MDSVHHIIQCQRNLFHNCSVRLHPLRSNWEYLECDHHWKMLDVSGWLYYTITRCWRCVTQLPFYCPVSLTGSSDISYSWLCSGNPTMVHPLEPPNEKKREEPNRIIHESRIIVRPPPSPLTHSNKPQRWSLRCNSNAQRKACIRRNRLLLRNSLPHPLELHRINSNNPLRHNPHPTTPPLQTLPPLLRHTIKH